MVWIDYHSIKNFRDYMSRNTAFEWKGMEMGGHEGKLLNSLDMTGLTDRAIWLGSMHSSRQVENDPELIQIS